MIELITQSELENIVRTELTKLADLYYGYRKYSLTNLEKIIQFVIQSEQNLEFGFLSQILSIGTDCIWCYGISCITIPIFEKTISWEFHHDDADITMFVDGVVVQEINYSDPDIWNKIQETIDDIVKL